MALRGSGICHTGSRLEADKAVPVWDKQSHHLRREKLWSQKRQDGQATDRVAGHYRNKHPGGAGWVDTAFLEQDILGLHPKDSMVMRSQGCRAGQNQECCTSRIGVNIKTTAPH